jgi:hypothetical protein
MTEKISASTRMRQSVANGLTTDFHRTLGVLPGNSHRYHARIEQLATMIRLPYTAPADWLMLEPTFR